MSRSSRPRRDFPTGSSQLSRRSLLAGLAAQGILIPAQGMPGAKGARAARSSATPTTSTGLVYKGITYDVGTDYTPRWGILSRQVWDTERVTREIATIHDDLHCTAIAIFGTEIDRLVEGAAIALEQGLDVWIQPRLIEADAAALIDHLTEVAREAERLRETSPNVTLNLGVELSLFASGIIPGATFVERIATLIATVDRLPLYNERLNELLRSANAAARAVFNGPLTYGAGAWEGVDWRDFDVVGMDLYMDAENRSTYLGDLRALKQHGKPVVITEFGCCCYEGAEDAGGSGYDIVAWDQAPPELNGDYVRSEQVQADYISDLLDIYEAEGIAGAFVYTFVEPGQTYSSDPRYDLDMASFGLIKVFSGESGQGYEETGYWEPKEAFREIARRYGSS